MSYLQGFNYSFVPSVNLGGGFAQVPFAEPNRFIQTSQQQQSLQSKPQYGPAPTPPGANIPIPESIVQNPQSYIDYYGNPTTPQGQQQQQQQQQQQISPSLNNNEILQQNQNQQYYENTNGQQQQQLQQNFQQEYSVPQQPQVPQQGRRRRTKNGRTRNAPPPALNYGPEHLQHLQNFHNLQNPQTPSGTNHLLRVTPIQGPIFAKDGHVPVVPLYSYNAVKNGTFYQIPILWTALSYALGLEIRGEIIRGLPCIKRLNQLFCPTAGNTYPLDNIERFIDENKALIKRMYGEFIMSSEPFAGPLGSNSLRRSAREIYEDEVPELFNQNRNPTAKHSVNPGGNDTLANEGYSRSKRQTVNPRNGGPTQQPKSNRVDSCESTVEIVTPYWAANSAGKVRAIVNTQHFEQAIHQEVCAKTSTKRCTNDCGCEQKYKWHRLLAYDPDNDCRGIFMDWFLFPSCCVCRCNP